MICMKARRAPRRVRRLRLQARVASRRRTDYALLESAASVSDDERDPSNAEILKALQGMWRQQADLIQGVEGRLGGKVEQLEKRLDQRLEATEQRIGDRLAQEIQDRPIVVHVDMSRVSELEKQVAELARRVAELEMRNGTH